MTDKELLYRIKKKPHATAYGYFDLSGNGFAPTIREVDMARFMARARSKAECENEPNKTHVKKIGIPKI